MTTTHTITRAARRAVTTAAAVVVALASFTAPASAGQVDPATHGHHGTHRATYVERVDVRRFYVETADGAAYRVRRCVTEDDARPCLWNAARRGNGRGTSFVRVTRDGAALTVPRAMMRRAYR